VNLRALNILIILFMLIAPGLVTSGWAMNSYMRGSAEVLYNKYDAEIDGKEILSGDSLVQKYSLTYTATNLAYKAQPRYYDLNLGYDWIDLNTKAADLEREVDINQTYGKFKYSGDVGYSSDQLPLRLRAYINESSPFTLDTNLFTNTLIPDGLVYNIAGRGKSTTSGVSLVYDPVRASSASLRELPRLMVDYREHSQQITNGFTRLDNKTKELAVASLSQGDNWLIFKTRDYENFLVPLDKYSLQEFQVGHVDYRGQRNWSLLTNWIKVSVDGRMTTIRNPFADSEEYDVNFMGIAERKLWTARTFMNYNRQTASEVRTESYNVPVYVKGIYGRDTDWYVSLGANRGRQQIIPAKRFDTAYTNSLNAGGTTFKHASFTLSPSINLETSKFYFGTDAYSVAANLESVSTRRFSDKLGLAGRVSWRAMDDGYGTGNSKSWTSFLDLNGTYAPNNTTSYRLQERIESGSGAGFLATYRERYGKYTAASSTVGTYLRNYLYGMAQWTPSAQLSMSLEGSYDYITATDLPASKELLLAFRSFYQSQTTILRFDSRYKNLQNGFDPTAYVWVNSAEASYRPDRYSNGLLRFRQEYVHDLREDTNQLNVLQQYNYNFFTRTGISRNIATITEEYSYISADSYGLQPNTDGGYSTSQYLMLLGRYNPTDRLSLYGSAKYEYSPGYATTMYYAAGMSANFRLFNASLDYAYARRDSDSRVEKKLTTQVSRVF